MRHNVVDLLTRYPVRGRFDPRENRLTAAAVAALDQAHSLRAVLIEELWKASDRRDERPATSERSRATAQKAVALPGQAAWFVDVELAAANDATLVWIEAKVSSGLNGSDQLNKYVMALAKEHATHKLLVLLAPAARRRELEQHLPQHPEVAVAFASWAQVHRALCEWTPTSAHDRSRRWLVKEVVDFMAGQGHVSVPKLTKLHHDALRRHATATEAVQHLFDAVASQLADRWTPIVDGGSKPRHWDGWLHQLYRPYLAGAKSRASPAYHSFGFAFETLPSQATGLHTPVFGAGVYFKTPLSLARAAAITLYAQQNNDWRHDLDDAKPYLWRDLPLADILDSPNIDAQAKTLSRFIGETFEMLNRSAPDTIPPG